MDVMEKIRQQVEGNPIVLYMKGSPDFPQCGFSQRAVQALRG
ncbi:MAG: monothiol glutaredoxin, Grx4 family, partial [Gammaproteobacteria bacterium]